MKKIPIQIICKKITHPRPWNYEVGMVVFGTKIFLTFGDTKKATIRHGIAKLRKLLRSYG